MFTITKSPALPAQFSMTRLKHAAAVDGMQRETKDGHSRNSTHNT